MRTYTLNIGKQFSRYPVGRYLADGDANGQLFREEVLRPLLTNHEVVVVELDDALGYGSSFLEAVFGGLVRTGFSRDLLLRKLNFITEDESLIEEITSYIREAESSNE